MGNLSSSQKVGLGVIFAILAGLTGLYWLGRGRQTAVSSGLTLREAFSQPPAAAPVLRPPASAASSPALSSAAVPATAPASPENIAVHVAGAVKKPGVYHLPVGARGEDALKAAGGAAQDANTDAINLAAKLDDGSQLYFPTRKQQPTGGAPPATPSPMSAVSASGAKKGGRSAARPAAHGNGEGRTAKLTDPKQGTVNINTASAEELQRLPGIGPAMAARLLAYRKENGGFRSADDLMSVSGIGERKFARLQPFVRLK